MDEFSFLGTDDGYPLSNKEQRVMQSGRGSYSLVCALLSSGVSCNVIISTDTSRNNGSAIAANEQCVVQGGQRSTICCSLSGGC